MRQETQGRSAGKQRGEEGRRRGTKADAKRVPWRWREGEGERCKEGRVGGGEKTEGERGRVVAAVATFADDGARLRLFHLRCSCPPLPFSTSTFREVSLLEVH